MGWSYTRDASKQDIIDEITRTQLSASGCKEFKTLKKSVRGNVLWTVTEVTDSDTGAAERFIGCFLLASDPGYGWGYKAMEESMHPYYYTCPLGYLDMAPAACEEWRLKVRQYHANQRRKIEIGERVDLVECRVPWVEITRLKPLLGVYGGRQYKIPRNCIKPLEVA